MEIPRGGGGGVRAQIFNGLYDAKLEFPGGMERSN